MRKIVSTALAVLFFLLAVNTLFEAKQLFVWKLSILATEYGHFLGLLCFLLALFTITRVHAAVFILSAALFFRPAVLAFANDKKWADELGTNLSTANDSSMLSAKQLWRLKGGTPVEPERFVFTEQPEKLTLDFYRTACTDPAPWILVVHGGGWDSGDQNQFRAFNAHLVHRGYSVVAMSYRLAPRWKWPAQRDDVAAAVRYARTRAKEWNIDPDNWALLGRSAGGQIAQAYAYQNADAGLKGLVAFYAPADLKLAYDFGAEKDIINSRGLVRNFVGGSPDDVPDAFKDASPIEFAAKNSPPTLLFHGGLDALTWVEHSRRLTKKLRDAGARVAYIELPWATHAFDFNLNGPGGQVAASAIDRFFDVILNKRGDA